MAFAAFFELTIIAVLLAGVAGLDQGQRLTSLPNFDPTDHSPPYVPLVTPSVSHGAPCRIPWQDLENMTFRTSPLST